MGKAKSSRETGKKDEDTDCAMSNPKREGAAWKSTFRVCMFSAAGVAQVAAATPTTAQNGLARAPDQLADMDDRVLHRRRAFEDAAV